MPHLGTTSPGEGESETVGTVLPSANAYPSEATQSPSSSSTSSRGALLPSSRDHQLTIEELQRRAENGDAGAQVDLRVEMMRQRQDQLSQSTLSHDEKRKTTLVPPKGWLHFVAGGVGGMCGAIVTSPLDVVKTRLQSNIFQVNASQAVGSSRNGFVKNARRMAYHFVETGYLLKDISVKEGPRALFKGLGPTLVGVIPARSINFFTYGNGKFFIAEQFNGGQETPIVHLCAAASAGIVTATATNPIWVVKTRLQLESHALERAAVVGRQAAIQRGDLARRVGAKPSSSTQASFSTSAYASHFRPSANVAFFARPGALTESPTFFKSAPSPPRPSTTSLDMTLRIVKSEGISGLYKGMSASYLGVAESTIQWVLYERLKDLSRGGTASNVDEQQRESSQFRKWFGTVGAAGTAKMVASLITYPHEVVRTRLRQEPPPGQPRKYHGLLQTIQLVFKEEGTAALYGGLSAHLLRVVPNAAIMFVVYETMLGLSQKR